MSYELHAASEESSAAEEAEEAFGSMVKAVADNDLEKIKEIYNSLPPSLQKQLMSHRTRDGMNLLHALRDRTGAGIIDWLIEHGVSFDEKYRKRTPLHVAAQKNNVPALQALLKHGAHLNTLSDNCKTAWDYAEEKGATEATEFLQTKRPFLAGKSCED